MLNKYSVDPEYQCRPADQESVMESIKFSLGIGHNAVV